MDRRFFKGLTQYLSLEPENTNKLIVTLFAAINDISSINNELIKSLIIIKDEPLWHDYNEFRSYYLMFKQEFSFEDLIAIFEFVISPLDKVVNGAVYTPGFIREYIIKSVLAQFNGDILQATICDVACGCGGFLFSYSKLVNEIHAISFEQLYSRHIYGVDLTAYSIERTELILSLLALSKGEDKNFVFNLIEANTLAFDWGNGFPAVKNKGGFDMVLGNPPYVCSKNISDENRALLERWPIALSGNPDLYIPFFQIGLEALHPEGILGYITVNTFTKSLNGRKLRHYLSQNRLGLSMIDFGSEQVFKGRRTYTCICIISRAPSEYVKYIKTNSKSLYEINNQSFVNVSYNELDNHQGWILGEKHIQDNLHKLQKVGRSLGNIAEIRGGVATLKNSVFIFKPQDENPLHYSLINEKGKKYNIEKAVCRNVVKANSLKSTSDFDAFAEKIIFPYKEHIKPSLFNNEAKGLILIDEEQFKVEFPGAYSYLCDAREMLLGRDKGKGEYNIWYAFGRTQGLNVQGYKLLFPHISDKPYFVLTEDTNLLFYTGFSIISWDKRLLKLLQRVLSSRIFWYYIEHTSKPYSGNYFALGKNYMKDFGIPHFTEEEEEFLLHSMDENEIEEFLIHKYGLSAEFQANLLKA